MKPTWIFAAAVLAAAAGAGWYYSLPAGEARPPVQGVPSGASSTPVAPVAPIFPRPRRAPLPVVPPITDPCSSLPRPASQAAPANPAGPLVSFNFDDGFLSAYEHGIPLINRAGFPITEYVITGDLVKADRIDAAQVEALAAAGNEIGAHTRTHPFLTRISPTQAEEEICGSRRDLLALGVSASTFAYPEGDADATVEQIVRQAGFSGARVTRAGLDNRDTDPFMLVSYQVIASSTLPQVAHAIALASQRREWLILTFHRVDEDGNRISVRHELIEEIVALVKADGIPVVTNAEGLSRLSGIADTGSGL